MSTRWPRTYWFSSCGGFFSWLIADRFSIVAVKIENEGLIVAWMVLGAKPGSTVVMPAAMAASWKAPTVAQAANAIWKAWLALADPEVRLARPSESS